MYFMQIYYPEQFKTYSYTFCKKDTTRDNGTLIQKGNRRWKKMPPGTDIFNNFYLELIL